MPHQAFYINPPPYVNSNSSYGPKMANLGFDFCGFWFWILTSTICMVITFVNDNKFWKFHDGTMTGTLWKGVTDRRTGGRITIVLRAAWSQLKRYPIAHARERYVLGLENICWLHYIVTLPQHLTSEHHILNSLTPSKHRRIFGLGNEMLTNFYLRLFKMCSFDVHVTTLW